MHSPIRICVKIDATVAQNINNIFDRKQPFCRLIYKVKVSCMPIATFRKNVFVFNSLLVIYTCTIPSEHGSK